MPITVEPDGAFPIPDEKEVTFKGRGDPASPGNIHPGGWFI
jgi:hypothetical protein